MHPKPTTPKQERLAYPVNDACFVLGIKRTSLYEMIKKGEIKAIKIAGRTVIPTSELERLTKLDEVSA